jgi:rhamnose transport system ATP-binding protein
VTDAEALLTITGVSKRFGGTVALADVSLTVAPGEVVGLVGENGSGKSTLMGVVAGTVVPDEGEVHFGGFALPPGDVPARVRRGVGVVFQEPTVCPDLKVVENVLLGQLPRRFGFVSWRRAYQRAQSVVDASGLGLPVGARLSSLSQDDAHLTDVVRLLARDCRLLVFDETTASLTSDYVDKLFTLIDAARRRGMACIFISHRLDEVSRICDRVVVLRDGQLVADASAASLSEPDIIRHMVGRELAASGRREPAALGQVVLDVQGLAAGRISEPLDLQVKAGQVVGIGGLVGSGRSSVLEAVFGLRSRQGTVSVDGVTLPSGSVRKAVASGVGLVPEDRRADGLAVTMSVRANATLVESAKRPMFSLIDRRRDAAILGSMRSDLALKAAKDDAPIGTLSGGNQQKVVLGRWLAEHPKLLLLDEPTRGIDVGAKAEIYELIDRLAADGVAILLVTSELEELVRLSDEVLVLREGRVAARLPATAGEDAIALAMAGS